MMTDLGTLPGFAFSEAIDINEAGQVVGLSTNSILPGAETSAFLWDGEALIDLGHLADRNDTTALAINDSGQIVGISALSVSRSRAFLWETGTMTDLGTLGGSRSIARDISSTGQVVGGSFTGSGEHAFLWSENAMQDLGTLGGTTSVAVGINDSITVVGHSGRENGSTGAFVWQNGHMTDLGALVGPDTSRALALNNRGQVVGTPRFLYDATANGDKVHDLQDLIPPEPGWFRYELRPRAINDSGQIVGDATFPNGRHAFLMTPIDTDFDDDGDTDSLDFAAFHSCLSGPSTALNEECRMRDIDRNGVVDLKDVRVFQWNYSPP